MADDKIDIRETEREIGSAEELTPRDKMRAGIARDVLGAIFLLIIIAGLMILLVPEDRKESAIAFFDFVRQATPPLITLVIGFYFNSQNGQ